MFLFSTYSFSLYQRESGEAFHYIWVLIHVCGLFPMTAVPPLAASTISPSLALLANNLSMPTSDLPPGASPRKKPRKQQHVISTEEGDMMETNSTDDEKSTAKSLLMKAEKRKSPPKEYIGNGHWANYCHVKLSHFNQGSVPEAVYVVRFHLWLTYWNCTLRIVVNM